MPPTGIHNENEFYSHHYLAEIFAGDIQATLERWQAGRVRQRPHPWAELRALAPEYLRFRGDFNRERRSGQRILRRASGSAPSSPPSAIAANRPTKFWRTVPRCRSSVPVAGFPTARASSPSARSMPPAKARTRSHRLQFHGEAPPPDAVLNETWETIVTRRLFAQTHLTAINASASTARCWGGASRAFHHCGDGHGVLIRHGASARSSTMRGIARQGERRLVRRRARRCPTPHGVGEPR